MEQEVALKPLCRGGFVSTERSGVRYIHMFSFSSVEALRIFLEEHPETRNANLHLASEEYVQCYANFIFRQEHNAEDLDEIFSYALRGECLPLLRSFPAGYDFFADRYKQIAISNCTVGARRCDILDFFIDKGLCNHSNLAAICLYEACMSRKLDFVIRLLNAGAKPYINAAGYEPLPVKAARFSSLPILHHLVVHGANFNAYAEEIWWNVIERGDTSIMQFFRDMRIPLPDNIIRDYLVEETKYVPTGFRIISPSMLAKMHVVLITLRSFGAKNPESMEKIHLTPEAKRFLNFA